MDPLKSIFFAIFWTFWTFGIFGTFGTFGTFWVAAIPQVTDNPLIFVYDPTDEKKILISWNFSADPEFATEILYRPIFFLDSQNFGPNSNVGPNSNFGPNSISGPNLITGRQEYGMWRQLAKAPIRSDFSHEFRKNRFCDRYEFRVFYNQTAFQKSRENSFGEIQNQDPDFFRSQPRSDDALLGGEVTMLQIPQILDLPEPHWSNRSQLRLEKISYK